MEKGCSYFFPIVAAELPVEIAQSTSPLLSHERRWDLIYEGGGDYPEGTSFFRLYHTPSSRLIECERLGEFEISNCLKKLTCWKHPHCSEGDFEHYCLSAISAIILELCGILAIHGSSFLDSRGTTLVLGESGAGKSTAAANAVLAGAALLNDDITPVRIEGGNPVIIPGVPKVKAAPIMANRILCNLPGAQPARTVDGKQEVFLKQPSFSPSPLSLIQLTHRDESGFHRQRSLFEMEAADIMQLILEHSYISPLVQILGIEKKRFLLVTQLVNWISHQRKLGEVA